MVKVILIENNQNRVLYQYLVEYKEEDSGTIFYDKKAKKYGIEKEAPGDSFGNYSGHAFGMLREFVEKDKFPETDTRQWSGLNIKVWNGNTYFDKNYKV